jgi:site-specific DNA-methyltransferase (adenine-specific)
MPISTFTNTLYYGDNLQVLRNPKFFQDESIDLIYLDPPFNSKADYNVLFREATGEESTAQIQAFSDFWMWDTEARRAYDYLRLNAPNEDLVNLTQAFFDFLGKSDMSAYLFMMAERLLELHRVLKPTGSIYLHCDPTASHYLKMILDAIFGPKNFRNEIVWKRFNFHADAKRFGRVTDRILFYSKSDDYTFNKQYAPFKKEYLDSKFIYVDEKGKFRLDNLNPPGGRGPVYEFHGVIRPWRYTKEKMLQLEEQGLIYTKSKVAQKKRYLQDLEDRGGAVVHEIWDDVAAVNSQAKERMGFQTQKPLQLLERIIQASSNEGDIVLDPFCGCGTAIIAAEKLHRHWIGIDITFLAINLIKNRLNDTFPKINFEVRGEPRDLDSARELAKDRYQFQWWALSLVGARPVGATSAKPKEGRKGADEGIDGWLRFSVSANQVEKIVVQVKSGHVGVKDIRELRDVVSRQNAAIGLFLTLEEPTDEMIKEVKATDPYVSPNWNHEYPKIQILTVEQLIKNERPDIPPISNMFKEAEKVERKSEKIQKKLG